MKKLATILLALATIASPLALRAKTIQKSHPIKAFERLEASNALNISYIQGTPVSLKVSGEESDIATLKIKQVGQKLKISRENKKMSRIGKIEITVTTPVIKEIDLSGKCKFSAKRLSRNGDIDIDLSGASSVNVEQLKGTKIDIDCSGASQVSAAKTSASKIEIDLSGASSVNMCGTASELNVECSGASTAELSKLAARTGCVEASGASRVKTKITTLRKSEGSGSSILQNN